MTVEDRPRTEAILVPRRRAPRGGVYVMAIHVPVFLDGEDRYVATDWLRALRLLRASLEHVFDEFVVVAPALPAAANGSRQTLERVSERVDGVRHVASMDYRCGVRGYWLRERRRWMADAASEMQAARAVHLGMNDLYRPINFDAFRVALRTPALKVFVRDTDEIRKSEQLAAAGVGGGLRMRLYNAIYERRMRYAVAKADLSLLKGDALFERYAPLARDARVFQNTSHSLDEVVAAEIVAARCATLKSERPLRLVYCGRLERRKGVDHSIRMVAQAARAGVRCCFDLIGDGAQRGALEKLAAAEGVADRVRFLGRRPYGAGLFAELAGYDALLFTPIAEDTPRMIFDGFACGLPLVAYDIDYVRERARHDLAVETIPMLDVAAGAATLARLDADRDRLAELARLAHAAGRANAAEEWYRRRADWTLEALERRETEAARFS